MCLALFQSRAPGLMHEIFLLMKPPLGATSNGAVRSIPPPALPLHPYPLSFMGFQLSAHCQLKVPGPLRLRE